ncbi:MAG: hypothetical protein BWX45_00869 [Deltaproteobacteria bacterium ADurb.Bin002]|nr:MAG: hypothetical protein BWX45_00869 [Deltaproteobacteria bacterium ADurb.Bin002]
MPCRNPTEQGCCPTKQYIVSTTDCLMTDCLRKMAFADTRRSDEEHILLVVQKLARGNFPDCWLVDLGVEGKVKSLKSLVWIEA